MAGIFSAEFQIHNSFAEIKKIILYHFDQKFRRNCFMKSTPSGIWNEQKNV
jgi:hypothetical protein